MEERSACRATEQAEPVESEIDECEDEINSQQEPNEDIINIPDFKLYRASLWKRLRGDVSEGSDDGDDQKKWSGVHQQQPSSRDHRFLNDITLALKRLKFQSRQIRRSCKYV